MRINVYTEELLDTVTQDKFPMVEIVTAEYVSVKTGKPMKNYGLRIFLKSHPDLHYVPPRDDDRTAITFWVGADKANVFAFIEQLDVLARLSDVQKWRDKTVAAQDAAELAEAGR